jgi:hypothetical protein
VLLPLEKLQDAVHEAEIIDQIVALSDAHCAYRASITNNLLHPTKTIKITGQNVLGFTVTQHQDASALKTLETKIGPTTSLSSLDPGQKAEVAIYTSSDCGDRTRPDDQLRIFTPDDSAQIHYVNLPDGSLGVWMNEHSGISFMLFVSGGFSLVNDRLWPDQRLYF